MKIDVPVNPMDLLTEALQRMRWADDAERAHRLGDTVQTNTGPLGGPKLVDHIEHLRGSASTLAVVALAGVFLVTGVEDNTGPVVPSRLADAITRVFNLDAQALPDDEPGRHQQ